MSTELDKLWENKKLQKEAIYHNFITELTEKAGVKRIKYEFWAWDSEH